MNDPDLAEKAVNVKHTPTIRDFIHNSMNFWLKFFWYDPKIKCTKKASEHHNYMAFYISD